MAIVTEIGTGTIDRIEGSGGTLVVFIAMCILFGAATYFTGRLVGPAGYITCAVGLAVVVFAMIWFVPG